MKKTQKILIMLAIFLISIGVVGCSSNKEEDKKNIATQKKKINLVNYQVKKFLKKLMMPQKKLRVQKEKWIIAKLCRLLVRKLKH
ncbi:hypothetical protein VJI77_06090 [Parvimonas sp. D2]|uniref:hypothetical protein n=1 Tax=unclassified Parvimonas TaxID=1151464 RepID=UPI002B4A712C|nr:MULTISPECIES: hypothetical protein [unclassified Parvimonas]MEB3012550.1 hypothetical protein [Parvimonas sp. D2]MEB3088101.1 hypothetical protein [Parvimonas sp. D4]